MIQWNPISNTYSISLTYLLTHLFSYFVQYVLQFSFKFHWINLQTFYNRVSPTFFSLYHKSHIILLFSFFYSIYLLYYIHFVWTLKCMKLLSGSNIFAPKLEFPVEITLFCSWKNAFPFSFPSDLHRNWTNLLFWKHESRRRLLCIRGLKKNTKPFESMKLQFYFPFLPSYIVIFIVSSTCFFFFRWISAG